VNLGRFGRGIRALRRRRGWRQADLAVAAGVSRSQVGRLERGDSRTLPVETVERIATAAGGSVDLLLRWNGEGLDRLLDAEHARLVEAVVRRLRSLGWELAVEVSFSRFGERGSIDVLAFHPVHRALAVFEVKSVTPDLQATLSGMDRKARLGPAIARERGWDPVVTARLLVVADTRTNRRRLEAHAATVRAVLPAGSREVVRWLADPVAPAIAGVWFLADVLGADRMLARRHRVRLRREAGRTSGSEDSGSGPGGGH